MVDVASTAVIVPWQWEVILSSWLSWTSTKIQIDGVEKCPEEGGTRWRVEREAKGAFQA